MDEKVNQVTVLVHGAPQILALTVDRDEDFVQKPRISESTLTSLQPLGVIGVERPAPLPNRFVRHDDAAFGQPILDIPEAQAVSVLQPDGVADGGMSRALLKFSGGSIHNYTTIVADSPSPNRASRARRAATRAGISLHPFTRRNPFAASRTPAAHPAQHHRPPLPAFHVALYMARATEQTLDGVRRGERSLETFRQPQAEHGQGVVESFADARGRTRVVGVQATRQVLQQPCRRLDVGVRVGAREDRLHPWDAASSGRCSRMFRRWWT